MPDNRAPNYPDLLGYITDGKHLNVGVVQVAMTIRPHLARIGQPIHVMLLLQNMSDVNVEVQVTLQLPKHAKRDLFFARRSSVIITVGPAEVGYIQLPVVAGKETPLGNYSIGMEVLTQPLDKPRVVRRPDGKGEVNLDYYFFVNDETLAQLRKLQKLAFTVDRRSIMGSTIEASFELMDGKSRDLDAHKLKPVWFSLWSLLDNSDVRPLLERYGPAFEAELLPKLNRDDLYKMLIDTTFEHFQQAGYDIQKIEAVFIAKLMTVMLEAGTHNIAHPRFPGEEMYSVFSLIETGWPTDGSPVRLPFWSRAMLDMMSTNNPAVMQIPSVVVASPLYFDVVRDTVEYGFHLLKVASKRDLASEQEIRDYATYVAQVLRNPSNQLTMLETYLPLVLAGVVVVEEVLLPSEKARDQLSELVDVVLNRQEERNEDTALIFELADQLTGRALRKYGYYYEG